MTVCIAALADHGKSLILAADRMIGIDTVESDMDVSKIVDLHKDWRVMFAGTFPAVFEIVDEAKPLLPSGKSATVGQILNAIATSYQKVRLMHAEAGIVKNYGYDLEYLRNVGAEKMGEATFREIISDVKSFGFDLDLLVAGFDGAGHGQIFKFDPSRIDPIERADVPGFDAIGSGAEAAVHMLYQRGLTYRTKLREALYYVLEAKYFGERASGVGPDTDLHILRYGREPILIKAIMPYLTWTI